MVSTMSKPNQRPKPTEEEAYFLISASRRMAWHGENMPCPRCGKDLIYREISTSSVIECSDEECISMACRGI
jgi:predicted RNA-binding Zn-ribbon protein involved in translation (DUF1610 family)